MKEEQSYNKLKEIEDVIKNHAAHINNTGILDDLLHEVAMAADQLEAKIEDHIGKDIHVIDSRILKYESITQYPH